MDINQILHIYALLLQTRSRLGLFHVNLHNFITEVWPLIDVKMLFTLNILRTKQWILTKYCIYALILTYSRLDSFTSIYANL